MPKLLIFDAFMLLIPEKTVANYALLRCKTFSLKIWVCKIFDKFHVWGGGGERNTYNLNLLKLLKLRIWYIHICVHICWKGQISTTWNCLWLIICHNLWEGKGILGGRQHLETLHWRDQITMTFHYGYGWKNGTPWKSHWILEYTCSLI